MDFSLINWWAVVVSTIAYMGIGMLWYGPLFGKQWMAYVGLTEESMKKMPLSPAQAIVGGVVTAFLMSTVLSYASLFFAAVTVMHALLLAFWIWLGFVATTQAGSFLWEGKPFGLFIINASNSLIALALMACILVLWR